MSSLFDPGIRDQFIDRISKLKPGSKAEWGKMNVTQMISHNIVPFEIAFGEKESKRDLAGILFGRVAKKRMINEKPFSRGLPTGKDFIIIDKGDFEKEKARLIEVVRRFSDSGPAGIKTLQHPFFGDMTAGEWDILMRKHLDHHLRQFNV